MQTNANTTAHSRPKAVILITVGLLLAALAVDYPAMVEENFFSDCATYYALADSLAHDFDLVYSREDLQRIYADFSGGPSGIFLQRNRATGQLHFGKAFIYPLYLSPFVALLGSDGILVSHAVLFFLFTAGIVKLLERRWGYWTAVWTALGFAMASTATVFYFWVAPEYFNMVLLFWAFFLVLYRETNPPQENERNPGLLRRFFLSDAAVLVSMLLVAVITYSKVTNGIYFLPLIAFLIYRRRFKLSVFALIAFGIGVAILFGIQHEATGNWSYQGGERKSFHREFPYANGNDFDTAEGTSMATDAGEWSFPFFPVDIANNMSYFLFGRFGGMLPYFAPAFLTLLLLMARRLGRVEYYLIAVALAVTLALWLVSFYWEGVVQLAPFIFPVLLTALLVTGLRFGSAIENIVLLAILASAMSYIVLIPTNVIGGGGTVGNRYFFNIYPLFIFLLPLRPKRWLAPASAAIALFFIGHILLNPVFHSRMPAEYGTTSHLKLLPVEYTMVNDLPINTDRERRRVPWYNASSDAEIIRPAGDHRQDPPIDFFVYHLDENSYVKEPNPLAGFHGDDGRLYNRLTLPGGAQQIWTVGGEHAAFLLRSAEKLPKIEVSVSTPGVAVTGWIELNGDRRPFNLEEYSSTTFLFKSGYPYVYNYLNPSFLYHLEVQTETGIAPRTLEGGSNDYRYLGVRLEFEVLWGDDGEED